MHIANSGKHQRAVEDRRQPPPFFSKYYLGFSGRRVAHRRSDNTSVYVDRYGWSISLIAIGIILMSVMDAAFTLRLLSKGAIELNAVMAILIEQDIRKFVIFKVALTSLSVLLLVIHKNVTLSFGVTVRCVAQLVFVAYLLLMFYELALFRILA